jgi:hypothetical protein
VLRPRTGVLIPLTTKIFPFYFLFSFCSITCVLDDCVNTKLHFILDMAVTLMNLKVHVLLERGNSEKL